MKMKDEKCCAYKYIHTYINSYIHLDWKHIDCKLISRTKYVWKLNYVEIWDFSDEWKHDYVPIKSLQVMKHPRKINRPQTFLLS